jgi:hypothetical protein
MLALSIFSNVLSPPPSASTFMDIAITPANAINLINFIFRTFEIRLIKKPGIDAR